MPEIKPEDILDQADRLLVPPAAGAAPRQVDLQRAISNAYYAIFHEVMGRTADLFIGSSQRHSPLYALVYRSPDHRLLRNLCIAVVQPNLPPKYEKYEPKGGFGADLEAVATAVSELYEKRHSADYDPNYRVLMSDAQVAVSTARDALTRFRNANSTKRKAFLTLLLFAPR